MTQQARDWVRLERHSGVAKLTLCRTGMQNALVPELLAPLLAILQSLHADSSVRAVVLAAEGPAFSIGGDMRRFAAEGRIGKDNLRHYSARLVGLLNEVALAMLALPQPIVGAIHGTVTGGSIGLLAGCDLVVMADSAVIKAHYANAGYCPDGGWTAWLPELIGARRVAAALLLNRSLPAADALEWGLANCLVPVDEVETEALAMAERIAAYPHGTMHWSKRLLRDRTPELAARLEAERRGFIELVATERAMESTERFLATFTNYPDDPS